MENERINAREIRVGDVQDTSDFPVVPPGRYIAKLNAIDPRVSKSGNPMIVAKYLILEGDYDGTEVSAMYTLVATKSAKNGKTYSRGLIDMQKAYIAVGSPLGENESYKLDPMEAAKQYGARLNPKKFPRLEIIVSEEPDSKDPKKKYTRVEVSGVAGSSNGTVGVPTGNLLDSLA